MINPSHVLADSYDDQTVSLINSERQKKGLLPLSKSSRLFEAATKHNNTMLSCAKTYGVNSCFKHQVTLLSEPALMERVKVAGFNPRSVAENIAWGYTSPAKTVSGWMGSSGHRANILGSYKEIGCDFLDGLNGSYSGMYWTCVFGTSFSATSPSVVPTTTATPTVTPTAKPLPIVPTTVISKPTTPTPVKVETDKPRWCKYIPSHYLCK